MTRALIKNTTNRVELSTRKLPKRLPGSLSVVRRIPLLKRTPSSSKSNILRFTIAKGYHRIYCSTTYTEAYIERERCIMKYNFSQRVKTRLNSTDRSPRGDLMLDPPKEDLHGSNSKWLGYERNVLPGTIIRLT